jgi:predicted  nucleic acid-binding Zn-ribbon protein
LDCVKASPDAQLRLLELADLDTELGRLQHRRRGLPEITEVERLDVRDAELRDEIVAAETEAGDLTKEQRKAEADVDQVRSRIERDRERLDAGQVSSPRELENLQSELASLRRRQDDLEEAALEVMERQEEATGHAGALTAERSEVATARSDAITRRDTGTAEIDDQTGKLDQQRSAIAADIPGDLLTLYEKLRDQHGVGAAALRRGRCEGCHLALGTSDLNAIRAAPPDEVVRCEECRRILVRTPESGL